MTSHTKYTRLTNVEENVTTSIKPLILVKLLVWFLAILMGFGMFIEVRKEKDIQNYVLKLEEHAFEVNTKIMNTTTSTKSHKIATSPDPLDKTRFTPANSVEHSKSSIPFIPPYQIPLKLRLNVNIETMMCANGTYDCIDFDEVRSIPSKLSYIPYKQYKQQLRNTSLHTNPTRSDYTFTTENNEVSIKIIPKNSNQAKKTYAGDEWVIRIVPTNEKQGFKRLRCSKVNQSSILKVDVNQNIEESTYSGKVSMYDPFFKSYVRHVSRTHGSITSQKFTLQVFFIRSAEAASLHRRVSAKINVSNRVWFGKFTNGNADGYPCSPLAPFLMETEFDENKTCAISEHYGREFYCSVPENFKNTHGCEVEKVGFRETSDSIKLGILLTDFKLDDFHEKLSFEQDFELNLDETVDETTDEDTDEHENDNNDRTRNELAGKYWLNGSYFDPNVEQLKNRVDVMKNRIFISVGDSINLQLIDWLKNSVGSGWSVQDWNFLGLENNPKLCGNVREYSPRKWNNDKHNITLIHIWHGHPLHNNWASKRHSCPFIQYNAAEILERMIKLGWFGKEYVFFTDIGVHLAVFNPIVIYKRLKDFSETAEKYLNSHPEGMEKATVIYKGMVFNRGRLLDVYSTISSTIMKRIQEIAEFVFSGSSVKVFDFWEMTEMVFDHQRTGEVHPGRGESSSSQE